MSQIFWMNCSVCTKRFNKTQRQPKINKCGHTFCAACSLDLIKCPTCQATINKDSLITNLSILDLLNQKKTNRDYDKNIRVCFVGESGVGKTSLINSLKELEFKEHIGPTIGLDFAIVTREIDDYIIRFQLWDSAGQEKFRCVTAAHYKNANILVVVYDITQEDYQNNVYSWYKQACGHCPVDTKIILVGNKIDLDNEKKINPLDSQMMTIIDQLNIKKYRISCKTLEGIEQFWQIMQQTVKVILNKQQLKQNQKTETAQLSKKDLKNSKGTGCSC